MSVGFGVLLFVIGAILRFALNVEVAWVNLALVGNILMGAGVVVFVLGLIFAFRKRQSRTTRRTVVGQPDGDRQISRTDRIDDTDI